MRACRCVSERRSRASTEVIGQYQSQPRDNHSPAMRLADACVRAWCACAFLRVRHSCKTNYSSRCCRAYPISDLAIFREGERRLEFASARDLADFCEENANAGDQTRRAGNSVSIRIGFDWLLMTPFRGCRVCLPLIAAVGWGLSSSRYLAGAASDVKRACPIDNFICRIYEALPFNIVVQ